MGDVIQGKRSVKDTLEEGANSLFAQTGSGGPRRHIVKNKCHRLRDIFD